MLPGWRLPTKPCGTTRTFILAVPCVPCLGTNTTRGAFSKRAVGGGSYIHPTNLGCGAPDHCLERAILERTAGPERVPCSSGWLGHACTSASRSNESHRVPSVSPTLSNHHQSMTHLRRDHEYYRELRYWRCYIVHGIDHRKDHLW